jgi:hypothetical protein
MEFIFELIVQIFFEMLIFPILKLLYKITVSPILILAGYITATVENKNDLTWDELEDIGWSNFAWILFGLLIILIVYIVYSLF